ncbi:hypothetical protein [Paenibacillus sp. FSL M7-0420]|uniref:hypothetical protein n=1 Tax=Paenibacillus sp. FSL M7-0420 TaxID=2921609 RepID=UPI0030F8D9A5
MNTKMYSHMIQFLWASEFQVIGGEVYIFLASSSEGFGPIRAYVMKLRSGVDLCNKADWERPEPVVGRDGKVLSEVGLTLDMTVVQASGTTYAIWAQRDLISVDLGSWIYIAEIDEQELWRVQ